MPGAFNRPSDFALMFGAIAGLAAWSDFAFFGHKAPKHVGIFIINDKVAVSTKLTDFGPRKETALTTLSRFLFSFVHGRLLRMKSD